MASAPLMSADGQTKGVFELPPVFGVALHKDLIYRYWRFVQASARMAIASVKRRGQVSGTGKKPWQQKGTGRARQGSTRSPQWRGGGVVFGPTTERNFVLRMNKKMRALGLMSALSSKVADGELSVIETVAIEKPKTKEMVKIQQVAGGAKVLVVVTDVTEALTLASRNLSDLTVIAAHHLNLGDLLRAKMVLITPEATEKIQAIWGPKLAAKRLPEIKTPVKETA